MPDIPSLTSSSGVLKSGHVEVNMSSCLRRCEEVHTMSHPPSDKGKGPSHFVPPQYDETLLGIRTKPARREEALRRYQVPPHWRPSEYTSGRLFFNILCLMSFGHAGMDPIWAAIMLEEEGDESTWLEVIQQMIVRLTNMNVVQVFQAGLLLTTNAAFLTTLPPKPTVMNYTLRGPYLCMLGSFALALGGIIVCSASLLVAAKARSYWFKEVLCANRFHVYCTLLILSYPFVSFGIATMMLAFGLLSAVWCSQDRGLKGACFIVFLLPVSMAVLFGVTNTTAKAKLRFRKQTQTNLNV